MRKIKTGLLFVLILSVALTGLNFVASAEGSLGRTRPVTLQISCDDFRVTNHITKSVKIAKHGRLEVTLCSNPSTGYSWSDSARVRDHTIAWQTSHTSLSSSSGAMGAPGQERWTFQGLREGTTNISFEYSRSGGVGATGNWTFEVKLTVVEKDQPDSEPSSQKIGEKLVRQVFEDIKNEDIPPLKRKMSKNFQAMHSFGISDRAAELKTIKGIKLDKFTLANFNVTRQDKTLIVTYTVKAEEKIKGEKEPKKPVPRLSVFVKTDSGWEWLAHANPE